MADVRHTKVSSGTVNPLVEVDLADWNATHTGIENIDNTSDVNKPVSTAQAAADAVVAANAAIATNLTSGTVPAARMPALTGDITTTVGTVATTLATVNANVGTFGSATQSVTVTFNGKGLATAASAATITPAVGSITGLGTGIATALAVNVGTAGSPVVNGGALGTPASGTATNLTGTASGLTAGNVTTNANLTGPVTSVGNATTIGTNQVTRANEAQGVARSVIGVTGNSTANVADIQGTASQFLGVNSAGTALAFQTMTTDVTLSGPAATIAANAVTNAKMATMAAFTFKGNNTSGSAVPTDVDIAGLTSKASPAATDLIILSDQAASGAWKKATVSSVASAGSVSSIAGNTGAFTLSNGITNSTNDIRLNIGHLPGETSNGSAAAGEIGEFISSTIVSGSAVSLTTATSVNVTSISLTAGDWDVQGDGYFLGAATTVGAYQAIGVSTTTATLDLTSPNFNIVPNYGSTPFGATTGNGSGLGVFTPVTRKSLSATTTMFLVANASFTVSTQTVFGTIRARRVR